MVSDGTLIQDGNQDTRHHPQFKPGDVIQVCFAATGERFDWKVNGQPMSPISNIAVDGRMLCVGGNKPGTRWRISAGAAAVGGGSSFVKAGDTGTISEAGDSAASTGVAGADNTASDAEASLSPRALPLAFPI